MADTGMAQRLVAHPRWMRRAGLRFIHEGDGAGRTPALRLVAVGAGGAVEEAPATFGHAGEATLHRHWTAGHEVVAGALPDLDDPATVGVLIGMLRGACDAIEAAGEEDEANALRRGMLALLWPWGRHVVPTTLLRAWELLDRIERGELVRPVERWVFDPQAGRRGVMSCRCGDREAPPTLSECHQVGLCVERGCWRRVGEGVRDV